MMKTLQELYNEVLASGELKRAFAEAVQNHTAEDFLKAHGCDASAEELAAFLQEQQTKTGELSDDELDSVSGGCNGNEALYSALSAGTFCVAAAILSAAYDKPKSNDGGILCADLPGNN